MACKTPRLILATSTNEAYWPRAEKCLRSYAEYSQLDNWALCIDCDPDPNFCFFHDFTFNRVNSSELPLPLNNWCLQDGSFLPYIPGDPSEVIIYTDADLTMQRPFSDAELATLRNLQPGQFFVGYNAGPSDTLADEACRLGMKKSYAELDDMFGPLKFSCFNWGCVAATRETWERICAIYVRLFPVVDQYLNHVAKQQWLLSWIVSEYFTHIPMPTSFHCHRHYEIPEGCEFAAGKVYSRGYLSLFAHKFDRD